MPSLAERMQAADRPRGGVLRLFFNYHAQLDPELVYRVFWDMRPGA